MQYQKTLNDIQKTKTPIQADKIVSMKDEWLKEWQGYMESGFSSFVQNKKAELKWYSKDELVEKIETMKPSETWFRLVLLECMLFEPYYPLSIDKNKKGKDVPSKKYDWLNIPIIGFNRSLGDTFLQSMFPSTICPEGYIKRLRNSYDNVITELNEVMKTIITTLTISAAIIITVVATAGAFAPAIATALVGSQFAGLSGAALTSASLAYLGGGAVAAGGLGMAGGTAAIVGGGALLGVGVGAGVGGTIGATSFLEKKSTIQQSAKLLVAVREIFLNDEKDTEYSITIAEQYVDQIIKIENELVELKLAADIAPKEELKKLKAKIKNAEETVDAMKKARKSMVRYTSSFEIGLENSETN